MASEKRKPTGAEPAGLQDTATKRVTNLSLIHSPVKAIKTKDTYTKKKTPPKIYFPVNEISAAWSSLSSEELRVALHVMALMWSDNDGTIVDDDWMIARRLGMPEAKWLKYRQTLDRAGWLIKGDGCLFNAIGKREFDLAQNALMRAIENGQKGGKAKAASTNKSIG